MALGFVATMRYAMNDHDPTGERTMTITLTSEIEKGLIEQAGKMGTSPELLAIETLKQRFAPPSAAEEAASEGSLLDFPGGFVACLSSDEVVVGGRMSKETGTRFAEGMLRTQGEGRPESEVVATIAGEEATSVERTRQRSENLKRLCERLDALPTAPIPDGMTNRDHDRILYGGS